MAQIIKVYKRSRCKTAFIYITHTAKDRISFENEQMFCDKFIQIFSDYSKIE